MADYLRLKDPDTGAEFTYDTAKVEALGLRGFVVDKDALGPDGKPAPTKPRLPLGEPPAGSAQERRRAQKTTEAKSLGEDAGQTSAQDKEN